MRRSPQAWCICLFPLAWVACASADDPAGAAGRSGRDAAATAGTTAGASGQSGAGASGQSGASAAAGSGTTDAAVRLDTSATASDTAAPTGGVPTFVAVGYAGRRVRSRDLGLTWTDDQTLGGGGDDEYLLRAVAFGKGGFVAVGHKILRSTDGAAWQEHPNPQKQWLGGIQFGHDKFAAAGGYGYSAWSADGLVWKVGGSRRTEAARSVAFGGGKWIAATSPGTWWASTDGQAWAQDGDGHSERVVYCGDRFDDASKCAGPLGRNGGRTAFGGGVYVSVKGSAIERSEDGTTWKTVKTGGDAFEGVAFGVTP